MGGGGSQLGESIREDSRAEVLLMESRRSWRRKVRARAMDSKESDVDFYSVRCLP